MRILILDAAEKEFEELDFIIRSKFDILFNSFKSGQSMRKSFKKMEGYKDLYEFRLKVNKRIYRALTGAIVPNYIILLVFNKKEQKTPERIIKKAIKRFNEYKNSI